MNTKMLLTGDGRPLCDACFEKQSELLIRRIEVKNGTVEIEGSVATEILLSFVGSALAILNGGDGGVRAENYVEMQCAAKELPGEIFTLTVQRPGGKTPHDLRLQAERERDELKLGLTDKNIADIRAGNAPDANDVKLRGVVWALISDDGNVVLEQCEKKARVLGVGEWFLPGGKIEGAESPEECLRREMSEEWPGVELLTARPLPIVEGSSVPPGPRGTFLMRPFVVTVRGDVPVASSEGTPLRWASVREALASPVAQVRMIVAAADYPELPFDHNKARLFRGDI